MSDAVEPAAVSPLSAEPEAVPAVEHAPPAAAQPTELPVPLKSFATSLRARPTPVVRDGKPVRLNGRPMLKFAPAHPDEIWLKALKIRHGDARLTPTQWRAAIDAMRNEPVHASDPRTR